MDVKRGTGCGEEKNGVRRREKRGAEKRKTGCGEEKNGVQRRENWVLRREKGDVEKMNCTLGPLYYRA